MLFTNTKANTKDKQQQQQQQKDDKFKVTL